MTLILISELDEEEEKTEKRVRQRNAEKENRAIEQRGAALLWPEGRNSPTLGSLPLPKGGREKARAQGRNRGREGAHNRRKDSRLSIQTVYMTLLHKCEPQTIFWRSGLKANMLLKATIKPSRVKTQMSRTGALRQWLMGVRMRERTR